MLKFTVNRNAVCNDPIRLTQLTHYIHQRFLDIFWSSFDSTSFDSIFDYQVAYLVMSSYPLRLNEYNTCPICSPNSGPRLHICIWSEYYSWFFLEPLLSHGCSLGTVLRLGIRTASSNRSCKTRYCTFYSRKILESPALRRRAVSVSLYPTDWRTIVGPEILHVS